MKFLTIGNYKDIYYTLPQAEREKLSVSTFEVDVDIKKKMGNKMHVYSEPGGNRVISIGEYSSIEEYSQSLRTPRAVAGFLNYECCPLIEVGEKALQAYVKSAKAAK